MLNNIKSGSAFDLCELNDAAVQALAAFLLKGEDLEKLESFLIAHGFGDFRLVYALWGAMFGFSKIPKTIFNYPFEQGDTSYAKGIYRFVHNVVHDIPLEELEPQEFLNNQEASNAEKQSQNHGGNQTILNKLIREMPECNPWLPKIKELLGKYGLNGRFVTMLNKTTVPELGGKLKKGTRKKDVVSFFESKIKQQPQKTQKQRKLPLNTQCMVFWEDDKAWDIIKDIVPEGRQERVKDTLKWFQNEWQNPNSIYYGWKNENVKSSVRNKTLEQRTNTDAVQAFCRVLERNDELCGSDIEELKRLLLSRY